MPTARYSALDTAPQSPNCEAIPRNSAERCTRSTLCDWKFERQDIVFEKELSTTLKSTISLGRWNGTQVVVKSSLGNDIDFTEELLHEIEVLSSLRHPDLVMFLGACVEPDQPIMCITEYLSGGDLERYYMKMQGQHETVWHPGLQQVLQWSSAVARALAFLHNRRVPILHRDLKPLNLLLTKHLDVKVADLGISKVLEGRRRADQADRGKAHYTMTGGVGSWRYMAPEVVRHKQYNEKVDIFAFALIMYFMSSGQQPFYQWGKDPEIILKEYLKGEEPRPSVSDCHVKVQGIIQAAWHVNWVQRPSAQDILGELEKLEVDGAETKLFPRPCMCPQM